MNDTPQGTVILADILERLREVATKEDIANLVSRGEFTTLAKDVEALKAANSARLRWVWPAVAFIGSPVLTALAVHFIPTATRVIQ